MSKFIVKKHSSRGVLGNFAKFTEKNLCQSSFFNKVAGLRSATLLKKRLCHKCFPVNFVKLLTLCVPRTYIYVLAVLCTQPVYIDLERINDLYIRHSLLEKNRSARKEHLFYRTPQVAASDCQLFRVTTVKLYIFLKYTGLGVQFYNEQNHQKLKHCYL